MICLMTTQCFMRTGAHSKELIIKTSQLNVRDFLTRMMYKRRY